MPSHNHQGALTYVADYDYTVGHFTAGSGSSNKLALTIQPPTSSGKVFRATSNGGNGAHNNMPPYLTVYMWKRTA